jgi:methylenetetrahydrofolate reductase (NADPH)
VFRSGGAPGTVGVVSESLTSAADPTRRFEILPFGTGEEETARLAEPIVVTVTSSPRHGVDRTVEVAARVRGQGHEAVVHLAARMVRDADHLDALLERMRAAGIDDVFLVAGDAPAPHGPFDSALGLLPVIHDHPLRPRRIGVGAYPEGHPLIEPTALDEALARKSELADYLATQLCFDPEVLLRWLSELRDRGIALPAYVGVPGAVDRRRLAEISLTVGVGASISFLRKQQGLRRLLGRPSHAAAVLHDALAPLVGDPGFGIAGLHYFTFNRVRATVAWDAAREPSRVGRGRARTQRAGG